MRLPTYQGLDIDINLPDVSMKLGYQGVFKPILKRKHQISVVSFKLVKLGLCLLKKKKVICQQHFMSTLICCASEYSHRIFTMRSEI